MALPPEIRKHILTFMENEITEYHIYRRLAAQETHPENRALLERIAEDEKRHYETWKGIVGVEVPPNRWNLSKYYLLSRILGLTFGLKLMERGEQAAEAAYEAIAEHVPEARAIQADEECHEQELLGLIDEERLAYAGSVVLGLNDALVELTGALAGFTLALQNARLIAITGLITGLAAALSMAASEYLSTKAEPEGKHPGRAALYTGGAYLVTVFLLILPFLFLSHYFVSMGISLVTAVLIIAAFNYYLSVARDLNFRQQFLEMAGVSFGVAAFSFLIGYLLRTFWGVEV